MASRVMANRMDTSLQKRSPPFSAHVCQRVGLRTLRTCQPRRAMLRTSKQLVVSSLSMEEQQKAMSDAEKRWQQNVRSGRVRSVSARELVEMQQSGEWKVLDVRPIEEVEKGYQAGSVHVPLFQVDDDMSPTGLLKQMSAFGMGGWWLGGQHMKPNDSFMPTVLQKLPNDTKVIVTCQKGLRSLAACESLARAGFENIAWLNGGYEAAEKGVIATSGSEDIRLAGVGGLSGVLGWNPIQQKEGVSTMDGPFGNVIKIAAFLVAVDAAAFLYEFSQAASK